MKILAVAESFLTQPWLSIFKIFHFSFPFLNLFLSFMYWPFTRFSFWNKFYLSSIHPFTHPSCITQLWLYILKYYLPIYLPSYLAVIYPPISFHCNILTDFFLELFPYCPQLCLIFLLVPPFQTLLRFSYSLVFQSFL